MKFTQPPPSLLKFPLKQEGKREEKRKGKRITIEWDKDDEFHIRENLAAAQGLGGPSKPTSLPCTSREARSRVISPCLEFYEFTKIVKCLYL